MTNEKTNEQRSLRPAALMAVAALSALLGFAAVYGTLTGKDNTGANDSGSAAMTPPKAPDGAEGAKRGLLSAFVKKKTPEDLPPVTFTNNAGTELSLASFKGKVVLLNLWATWCGPCREEMPSLDRLQKEMGSDTFEVVALAVDRTGADNVKKFLTETKVETLGLYVDSTAKSGSALKAIGLPTTILIDKEGREIGRLPGPAQWDSAEAKDLIRSVMK